MSWGIVGGAAISAVGGLLSSKESGKAGEAAADTQEAELAFAREQYDDFKEVFGPLQDNLSDYYTNLTPDYYAAVGLETAKKEEEALIARLDESLAQRGLSDSAVGESIKAQVEIAGSENRAKIRRDSVVQAKEEQRSFLQIGLGQNPAGSVSSALRGQSDAAAAFAARSEAAAGQAVQSAVSTIGKGVSDYFNRPKDTTATPQPLSGSLDERPIFTTPGQEIA